MLKARIEKTVLGLIGDGYTHFITGMALGADTYFAESVLAIKVKHDIKLEAAVPYARQSGHFSREEKARYNNIMQNADKVTVLCEGYTPYCFDKRNKYMVDSSDIVLVVNYAASGGTANTIRYAGASGKRIIDLSN